MTPSHVAVSITVLLFDVFTLPGAEMPATDLDRGTTRAAVEEVRGVEDTLG